MSMYGLNHTVVIYVHITHLFINYFPFWVCFNVFSSRSYFIFVFECFWYWLICFCFILTFYKNDLIDDKSSSSEILIIPGGEISAGGRNHIFWWSFIILDVYLWLKTWGSATAWCTLNKIKVFLWNVDLEEFLHNGWLGRIVRGC